MAPRPRWRPAGQFEQHQLSRPTCLQHRKGNWTAEREAHYRKSFQVCHHSCTSRGFTGLPADVLNRVAYICLASEGALIALLLELLRALHPSSPVPVSGRRWRKLARPSDEGVAAGICLVCVGGVAVSAMLRFIFAGDIADVHRVSQVRPPHLVLAFSLYPGTLRGLLGKRTSVRDSGVRIM